MKRTDAYVKQEIKNGNKKKREKKKKRKKDVEKK